jgi:hypothetical protein
MEDHQDYVIGLLTATVLQDRRVSNTCSLLKSA